MKKKLLLAGATAIVVSSAGAFVLRAEIDDILFGAGEVATTVCVDKVCVTRSAADYRRLKDKYKDKILNSEAFTYQEYKEFVHIIDIEAKKKKVKLKNVNSIDELTSRTALEALK